MSVFLYALSICLLSGCIVTSEAPAPSMTPESQAPSPTESEVIPAEETYTLEELHAQFEQYYLARDYKAAMMTAEEILVLDPANDAVYTMKAELLILEMKEANDSLNSMLQCDLEKLIDPKDYVEKVKWMYEEAGFQIMIPFTPDYVSSYDINTVGNISGNLYASMWKPDEWDWWYGVFTSQGDWIYFTDYNENRSLYKMKSNGEDKQLVSEDGACCLNVIGDWIYFSNISDNNYLYKIRTDGSMKTKLYEDNCRYICVSEDTIYYIVKDDDRVYAIRTDGTERGVFSENAQTIFIDDGYLYLRTKDEFNLIRMDSDGSNPTFLIKDQWNIRVQMIDGWIYYMTDFNGLVIMKMKPDGSLQTEVWRYNAKINAFAVSGSKLIVSVRDQDNVESILAIDLNTKETLFKLDNYWSEAICTFGQDTVFIANGYDNNRWYKIDWEKETIWLVE
ncbi:MAG: DUF5050 domain-containing protein [Clostridia bacterium]|nr:DUF5050 domain-containing protein [Clostridia bacterium]